MDLASSRTSHLNIKCGGCCNLTMYVPITVQDLLIFGEGHIKEQPHITV